MTVSYKKSGKAGSTYYTNHASEVDDYYTANDKEPPGVWYVQANGFGHRKTMLGIEDGLSFSSVDTKKFVALTSGFHPVSGEQLTQNAGSDKRVALHDFTLSPPKSVSVVWSQAGDELKVRIEDIQTNASKNFLDFITKYAVIRQGKGGFIQEKASVPGVLFNHGSSRANDPQLHTHSVLMNIGELEDGTTGALEARDMLRWQGAAASLYHADIAYMLRNLGFDIEKRKNLFEISGVPEEVCDAFSQRRKEILEAAAKRLKSLGMDTSKVSRALLQVATLESRKEKTELGRDVLSAMWKDRAAALGFTENEVNELIAGDRAVLLTSEQCKAEVKNVVDNILQLKAVFGEPELVAKSASALIGLASREQILSAIEEVKKELLVAHGEHERDTVFTSREMVSLEHEMLELSEDRTGKHIQSEFELPNSLSDEQRAAAEGVLRDDNYLTVVEGAAGAGKTYTMASVARAFEANGYKVQGLATAWTAALNLQNDADLAGGAAITGWLNAAVKGEAGIDNKTLLIVDEAGVVSAKQMRDVLAVAREHGAKVVLLGDTKQQKAVEAGASLGPIAQRLGSYKLSEIRRQHRVEEREAVKQLFDGQAEEALKTFALREGGLTVRAGDDEVNKALVDDWVASRSRTIGDTVDFARDGEELTGKIISQDERFWTVSTGDEVHKIERTHLILATDNRSVRDLNQLAQERLLERGLLGEGRTLNTIDGEQALHVGDEIQFRANAREHEVYNRMRGRIEGFAGDVMQVRLAGDKLVAVDLNEKTWRTEEGDLAVQLAYATTTYSSQGLTVGHSFVKDGWSLSRDSAGVAMSRHRESARIYADRSDHHERAMRKTLADQWKPAEEFTDADVQESMAKSWSKDNIKASTLDHIWQEHDGAIVDRAYLLAEQKEAERVARSREPEALGQKQPLPDLERASDRQISRAMEKLQLAGIDYEALKIAGEQGILRVDGATGEPVFLGRKGDGALMQVLPLEGPQKPDLRGRFPPILRGESDETLVVQDGMEALHTLTEYLDAQTPTPNIIITGGKPFALSGAQAKSLLTTKSPNSLEIIQKQGSQQLPIELTTEIHYERSTPVPIQRNTKPNIGRIGKNPPPDSKNRLRSLSQLGVVQLSSGGEMLLPSYVLGDMEQQRTQPVDQLRRNLSGAGQIKPKEEKNQSTQSVERDRSNDSARSERAVAIAKAEEATRRATAALQEQAQRPPERDAGLTR